MEREKGGAWKRGEECIGGLALLFFAQSQYFPRLQRVMAGMSGRSLSLRLSYVGN